MMDITIVDDKLRNAVISYAENCSWRAGKELARLMRRNEFKDWEKVFAVCSIRLLRSSDLFSWTKNSAAEECPES